MYLSVMFCAYEQYAEISDNIDECATHSYTMIYNSSKMYLIINLKTTRTETNYEIYCVMSYYYYEMYSFRTIFLQNIDFII